MLLSSSKAKHHACGQTHRQRQTQKTEQTRQTMPSQQANTISTAMELVATAAAAAESKF
jgi:hypothetical protein